MVLIGTWNLENFFRPGTPAGPSSQAAYDAKLAALADTIRALSPDVLAVQEVGDPEALADLADALKDDGYAHHEPPTPTGAVSASGSCLGSTCWTYGRSAPSPPGCAPSRWTTPLCPNQRWAAPHWPPG
jgi:hypothetical protein